jgi:hypothetical protein
LGGREYKSLKEMDFSGRRREAVRCEVGSKKRDEEQKGMKMCVKVGVAGKGRIALEGG